MLLDFINFNMLDFIYFLISSKNKFYLKFYYLNRLHVNYLRLKKFYFI